MSPHDCRLSHINWIEKLMPDVSPTTLKEHVGHAAVGVTEVNYTRPLTSAQEVLARGILSELLACPYEPSKLQRMLRLRKGNTVRHRASLA